MTLSVQTLTASERRLLASWAADCAERVLNLFESENPSDDRPRAAIARTRAFSRGDAAIDSEIRRRFGGGSARREGMTPAAVAAARAAGQASAVCHMGAHALGAAAYAILATMLARPQEPETIEEEMRWQLAHATPEARAALRSLPSLGEKRSGPLGPGLLASGQIGMIIRQLQTRLSEEQPE